MHPPFTTVADAQAAVDAWRQDYNATRPHQSLGMAFPAARFTPRAGDLLGLRIPAELRAAADTIRPEGHGGTAPAAQFHVISEPAAALPEAVQVSRVVPPSGNLWIGGQQIWLGPALAGRSVQVWTGLDRVHVLLDGHRIKTLPSRLDRADIGRLLASGATPAGQPPLPPATGPVIELERTVNAAGTISLGGHVISAGMPLAGQRVTVRLDGPVAHILTAGTLTRTVACPVPEHARLRLRGARNGQPGPPELPEPQTVRRRVSQRGTIMIGGQRIQVGFPHAGMTADVIIEADTYQIAISDSIIVTVARTSSRDIRRHKASHYPLRQPEGLPAARGTSHVT